MHSPAADIARRLAQDAEAVCRQYLSNGRKQGRYWIVGDVQNTPGRSLYVRLSGPTSGPGAAGKWTDSATGQHGDLLDLVALNMGIVTLKDTLEEARRFLSLPQTDLHRAANPPASRGSPEAARRLWAMGQPMSGTLTEDLHNTNRKHRLLFMLDEFPALGRLDFFESQLAFMAGYGLKAFLIAQSLNQIEKAYGQNNAILDNCHVRVAFATNDERTAKRLSDALGTTTELRAMKNYAGHRLSPWLGHLMVSRQETARALLTPGEIMQLPPDDEIILVSGAAPIRAQKVRYFRDAQLTARIQKPPRVEASAAISTAATHDWSSLQPIMQPQEADTNKPADDADGGIRREPDIPEHEDVVPELPFPREEFAALEDEPDDEAQRARAMQTRFRTVARQAALDPDDGIEL